jgi:ABC-type Fe3+-hydroxamate transport system substrate-binding protein
MKTKRFFLFGLPAVLLVLGLMLAGCASTGSAKDPAVATIDTAAVVIDAVEVPDEPKPIVITGYDGSTVFNIEIHSEDKGDAIRKGNSVWPPVARGRKEINGQTIMYALKGINTAG